MICGPAERLVRNPGPTRVGISPATVGVGPPLARLFRRARLPDEPVINALSPFAVRLELAIKNIVRLRRALFRFAISYYEPRRGGGFRSGLVLSRRFLGSEGFF